MAAGGPASTAVGRDFNQQTHHHYHGYLPFRPDMGGTPGNAPPSPGGSDVPGGQARDAMPLEAGDALASAVGRQWQEAARQRKLQQEIPVRWRRTRLPVAGEGAVTWGGPDRPRLVRSAPHAPALGDDEVGDGGIPELHSVCSGVASGRVVVLGAPGAGKSDAALLTVLRALLHRDLLREDAWRARSPVPVLFSIAGWDGRRLDDWIVARLVDDYRIGVEQATELVAGGWISLFLDSFDEMASDVRAAALREIDRAAYRVVIFSRSDEFQAAVADGHLFGAVVVELCPVLPSDAVAFLRTMPPLAPWQRLVTHVEKKPDSLLSHALSTPLILTLLRDAFPPRHIGELDDLLAARFASRQKVEEYLLARLVGVHYRSGTSSSHPRYEPAQVERWLSYVAARMSGQSTCEPGRPRTGKTYSLDWRRLHHWASPWPRIVVTALVGGFLGASGCLLAYGPGGYLAWGRFEGIGFGAVYGSAVGVSVSAVVGALAELRDPSPHWRGRLRAHDASRRARFHPPTGILTAMVVVLLASRDISWIVGAAGGAITGALAGFAATRVTPPRGWTGLARWSGLRSWPVLAPSGLAGICVLLSYWNDKDVPGRALPTVIVAMLSLGIVGVVMTAARPTPLTDPVTDPYTSWRQDRNFARAAGAILGFGIGLALGLNYVLGVVSDPATDRPGWGSLPFLVIGFGTPFAYACTTAVSDHWRVSLLFLQLRLRGTFPLRGMRFLKDAYDHRIFRAEGAAYQFRHALLQDKLAHNRESEPPPGKHCAT